MLKELPYLKKVTTAIPPTEDPPGIVDSLNTLANQTGCDLLWSLRQIRQPRAGPSDSHNHRIPFDLGTPQQRFRLLERFLQDEATHDD